jgi:murein DD-endopeptidase MepM/ murein hydrolase activator NlpD
MLTMLDYLKQKTKAKKTTAAIVLVALAISAAFSYTGIGVFGQSLDDLQKQKQAKQKQLDEINKKIQQFQTEINQRKKQASSLQNEIATINLEIAQTEAQIEATNRKIDVTNIEIADVTDKIVETENEISDQKEVLKELLNQINDMDQRSPLEVALENDNFTQFLDQLQYVTNIQERSQEVLAEIKKLRAELEIEQSALKKHKSDLDAFREQLDIAEAGLKGQRVAKQQLLDQTKGQERAYQKLLAEQKDAEEEIQREIGEIEAEINKRLGNKKAAAKKGLMTWPMDGTLTQGYGNTGFTKLGYTFHNGIDVAAPAGTPIYAAYTGVVDETGTGNGGYGNWIAIRHNNITGGRTFITLYAHLSSFKVKKGQSVKEGDLIGFEGNTGNTTRLLYGPKRGYHLHFTIFDAEGYGIRRGVKSSLGTYDLPYGATYNPLDFL